MSKQKRRKATAGELLFRIMGLLIILSMVLSLFLYALPEPAQPVPTPFPTWTRPAVLLPTALPPVATATLEIGPVLPTATPTPTLTLTTAPALALDPSAPPARSTRVPTRLAPTAQPSPTPEPAFTFAIAGDSRGNPKQYGKLLAAVMADGSEFLVHTGDLVNSGTTEQWQGFVKTMAGFALPFYPVPGNHDGLNGKLDGYIQYAGAPAAHYSFDRGPVHLTLADSHNGGVTAAELEWLRADLSASTQPIEMVVLHHPPFDPDGTDHVMAFGAETFMDLMVEQGVDYVFAGHIHAYSQAERDGVLYTITGGAGATLYRLGHPEAFYHYLRVTVQDEQVTIEVVKV